MTLRVEPGRRHGPHDPRWPSRRARPASERHAGELARVEPSQRIGAPAHERPAERRAFVVDAHGTCRFEGEHARKRRALIVWCDDLIAHLRGKGGSQRAELRRGTKALRDRLRDLAPSDGEPGAHRP